MRLVTAGPPDAQGRVRGVIDIFLKPGWKTYWRDPGSAGVPPTLDASRSTGVKGAELSFPTPQRHDDGYGSWAGYAASVAIPVTFTLADPTRMSPIEADLFLGVCRTICVPVQAGFSLDPAAGDEDEDLASVEAAFAALPRPADAAFKVVQKAVHGSSLQLEAKTPEGHTPLDLFLAGSELGYVFGTPSITREGGAWVIAVDMIDAPAARPEGGIPYTLVTDKSAVSGMLSPP